MVRNGMISKVSTMKYSRASNVKRPVRFNSNILTPASRSWPGRWLSLNVTKKQLKNDLDTWSPSFRTLKSQSFTLSRSSTITYFRSNRISCTKKLTRAPLVCSSRDEWPPQSTWPAKRAKLQLYCRRETIRRFRGQSSIRCKFSPLNRLEGKVLNRESE